MGRRKKTYQLTQEQIDYRNSILKPKVSPIKTKVSQPKISANLTLEEFVNNKLYYLNNCVFWINEYQEGRQDLNVFLQTLNSIEQHIIDMKKVIGNIKK